MSCYSEHSSAIFAEKSVSRESLQSSLLPMNGILTRKKIPSSINSVSGVSSNAICYLSMKVKVGHQKVEDDAMAVKTLWNDDTSDDGLSYGASNVESTEVLEA